MAYGRLTPLQRKTLRTYISGRRVHDLGAGDLSLAYELVEMGALSVVAIDKVRMNTPRPLDPITRIQSYFNHIQAVPDVAFVSWPANYYDKGLLDLIVPANTVVYLGKNTDGTCCGFEALFLHLRTRELLAYVPVRANTLLIVGPGRVQRKMTGEELAGLSMGADVISFEKLENNEALL